MTNLAGSFRLSFEIVRIDFSRRFALTSLGSIWFAAPFITTIAIAGTPSSINGRDVDATELLMSAITVCMIQLVVGSASETGRLARRNRRLLTHLGTHSLVVNISGSFLAQLLFWIQLGLVMMLYTVAGVPLHVLVHVLIAILVLLVPLVLLGFALSLLISFISTAILDIRYSFQFLPLMFVLFLPARVVTDNVDQPLSVRALNPFWSILDGRQYFGQVSMSLVTLALLNSVGLLFIILIFKRFQQGLVSTLFSRSL